MMLTFNSSSINVIDLNSADLIAFVVPRFASAVFTIV